MDADERLTALQKAYADIILNTSKEAAAKILASDRKALRFQHELHTVKEEALQMMVRLKQMMDSKISEAAMTSSSKQRKIEELEAQLQEAEDIVKDLREELGEVQTELERVTNNKEQNLDEHGIATPEETSEENRLCTSQSITSLPPESQHETVTVSDMTNLNLSERSDVCNPVSHMANSYAGNPDLPSLILRSKVPELYGNVCSPRIRACERNMLDAKLSLPGQLNDVKHETSVKEDEEGERIYTSPMSEADNMCNVEKKVVQEDSRLSCWDQVYTSFVRRRKRATRHRRNRIPSCRYLPDQVMKMDQTPDIFCSNANPISVKSTGQSEEGPSKIDPKLSLDTTEMGMHQGCAEANKNDAEFVKTCDLQNTINEGEALIDKLVCTTHKSGSTEDSRVPFCKMDLEKVDVPLVSSESKASDTINVMPSQPVNNRIIKYTFQRKRKRENVSSSNGGASVEKSTLERNSGEKQIGSMDGSVEPLKSISLTESSTDKRQLEEIALQLLSLSDKKWWQ